MGGSAGWTSDGLVVDHFDAIEDDGDVAVHQCEVVGVPFSGRIGGILGGSNPPEYGARSLDALHATVAIHYLGFVHATQVNTAVALGFDKEFDVQPKIFKLGFGAEVGMVAGGTEICFGGFIHQQSALAIRFPFSTVRISLDGELMNPKRNSAGV